MNNQIKSALLTILFFVITAGLIALGLTSPRTFAITSILLGIAGLIGMVYSGIKKLF